MSDISAPHRRRSFVVRFTSFLSAPNEAKITATGRINPLGRGGTQEMHHRATAIITEPVASTPQSLSHTFTNVQKHKRIIHKYTNTKYTN